MLDKHFDPKTFESLFYKKEEQIFIKRDIKGKPFSIMMPPPNVTGSLHLGHALTYTLQDILIRFKRMQGYDVFWQPGTDHAGIATQVLVEKNIYDATGKTRFDFTREEFLKQVWLWKEKSGDKIIEQQKRLCISANWNDAKFTLDEDLSKAVRFVFVHLFNDKLLYKDKRLVNWDPYLKTAISDLEVINKEEKGKLWYLRYTFVDDATQHIIVATTRPETIFADQAVAVHPGDDRYKKFVGKKVYIPLIQREISIITDEFCDIEKGSGAVKITPAHDFNDFDVGKRHHLTLFNILDESCRLNNNVPVDYQGLSTKDARAKIISDLEALNIIEKIEDTVHAVPYGDRSQAQIEPLLTDQWFVDTKKMAKIALQAVKDNETSFVPKQWENTYFDWMENIQPWCVSRQLWWGHQIPAWYGPDGTVFVAENEAEANEKAIAHYNQSVHLNQDEDVLDTWFSSALWPFSTLGWPEKSEKLDHYYPTSILLTGFDIIFFWVARMMMMGLYFNKKVPFKDVYIHALVRDEHGQKMSKSKGNVIDPLDLIEEFGVDALRFSLCFLSTPGRDIKIGQKIVENHRSFVTKIWNSARYLQMNNCVYDKNFDLATVQNPLSKWLLQELQILVKDVTKKLEGYRFDQYATAMHQWFWDKYCAQFLEAIKPVLMLENRILQNELRQVAVHVFLEILKLLHPIIPMVTEKLWDTFVNNESLLLKQSWPVNLPHYEADHGNVEKAFDFASEIRSFKGLIGIDPIEKLNVYFAHRDHESKNILHFKSVICFIARLNVLENINQTPTTSMIPFVLNGISVLISFQGETDYGKIKNIIIKKYDQCQVDLIKLTKKLENPVYKSSKPLLWADDQSAFFEKESTSKKLEQLKKIL